MVGYEWDVEEVAVEDFDDGHGGYGAEDVIDHYHQDSYADCLKFIRDNPAPEHCRYDIALVRDTDAVFGDRLWAYIEDGKMPEWFRDACWRPVVAVPKRFVAEVNREDRAARWRRRYGEGRQDGQTTEDR